MFAHLDVRKRAAAEGGGKGVAATREGEVAVTHEEPDGTRYNFVFQHAKVHCPILSVTELVIRDCSVTFTKHGGHILYPSGKKIRFISKAGVFFVILNVLPPGPESTSFHRRASP